MNVLDMFSRKNWRANLIDAMISKLGLSREMRQLPGNRAVMQRATQRCLHCDSSEACQQWLASADTPRSAPAYCRNHDLFERVIAGMEA